jgi:hypothetical protein
MLLGGEPVIADAVEQVLCASVREARMGRSLPGLLHAAGLREVTYEMVAFSVPWAMHEAAVSDPVREAMRQDRLPAVAATAWLDQQEEAAANGLFTVAFVGVLVGGQLPAV